MSVIKNTNNKEYVVNFFDTLGKCYYKAIATHIDISTWCTIIDFSKPDDNNKTLFRAYDEMQNIKVLSNAVKIEFYSGQTIVIYL